MRKFFQRILRKPVARLAEKFSSRPDKERVHKALTNLHYNISTTPGKKGQIIPFDRLSRFIILSDQHKGDKKGSDDFANAEKNYIAALDYYLHHNYYFISLGDSEELWENTLSDIKKHNEVSFEKERLFHTRNSFIKIFGNHDLYWDNDPLAGYELTKIYGENIKTYEGALLQTEINGSLLQIFLTHGHQGDLVSDGNWFSKWFISRIWAPLQAFLLLNPNTPAYDDSLKTAHNLLMYQWSALQKNTILITGHTHQPVFESLTHLERLYKQLNVAKQQNDEKAILRLEEEIKLKNFKRLSVPDFSDYKPSYFNTGCCCYSDGGITGIEIAESTIRLIKWEYIKGVSTRVILEEVALEKFIDVSVVQQYI
jgi:predicted phosphodiesterase